MNSNFISTQYNHMHEQYQLLFISAKNKKKRENAKMQTQIQTLTKKISNKLKWEITFHSLSGL